MRAGAVDAVISHTVPQKCHTQNWRGVDQLSWGCRLWCFQSFSRKLHSRLTQSGRTWPLWCLAASSRATMYSAINVDWLIDWLIDWLYLCIYLFIDYVSEVMMIWILNLAKVRQTSWILRELQSLSKFYVRGADHPLRNKASKLKGWYNPHSLPCNLSLLQEYSWWARWFCGWRCYCKYVLCRSR